MKKQPLKKSANPAKKKIKPLTAKQRQFNKQAEAEIRKQEKEKTHKLYTKLLSPPVWGKVETKVKSEKRIKPAIRINASPFEYDVEIALKQQLKNIEKKSDEKKESAWTWRRNPVKKGVKYYITVDGLDENSKNITSVVWIASNPCNPAYITHIPHTHKLEKHTVVLNDFKEYNKYNGVININYETNAGFGSSFFDFMKDHKLEHAILKRQDLTSSGEMVASSRLGTSIDKHTTDHLYQKANILLRQHISNIKSPLLIKELLKPANKHSHLRAAFLLMVASTLSPTPSPSTELIYAIYQSRDLSWRFRKVYANGKIPNHKYSTRSSAIRGAKDDWTATRAMSEFKTVLVKNKKA